MVSRRMIRLVESFACCALTNLRRAFVRGRSELVQGEGITVDGKQLRRSKDGLLGVDGIYMVNVWATDKQLSLETDSVQVITDQNADYVIAAKGNPRHLAGRHSRGI